MRHHQKPSLDPCCFLLDRMFKAILFFNLPFSLESNFSVYFVYAFFCAYLLQLMRTAVTMLLLYYYIYSAEKSRNVGWGDEVGSVGEM